MHWDDGLELELDEAGEHGGFVVDDDLRMGGPDLRFAKPPAVHLPEVREDDKV